MRRPGIALFLALALGLGCGPAADRARPDQPTVVDPRGDAAIAQRADDYLARAAAHEPAVSALLAKIAAATGGELAGFEHRLKTRASLIRKIHLLLSQHPDEVAAGVAIDDALRYTLVVEDQPAGHHVAAIQQAFAALAAAGQRPTRIKNYWPKGDNYSGVNSVLTAPDGLEWELQFHTAASHAIQERDHGLYEALRAEGTAPAQKRILFDRMSHAWDDVAIPAHLLDPGALGPGEEIILRPRP